MLQRNYGLLNCVNQEHSEWIYVWKVKTADLQWQKFSEIEIPWKTKAQMVMHGDGTSHILRKNIFLKYVSRIRMVEDQTVRYFMQFINNDGRF